MRIHRLPEELAAPSATPPVVDPLLLSVQQKPKEKFVTGVRLPAPSGSGRRPSLGRPATSPGGVTMDIDRACTLLVCFHDDAASTGGKSGGGGGGGGNNVSPAGLGRRGVSTASAGGTQLDLPQWATEMGLTRTNMHVRIAAARAGRVTLGFG